MIRIASCLEDQIDAIFGFFSNYGALFVELVDFHELLDGGQGALASANDTLLCTSFYLIFFCYMREK